jgi:class 3 adenylate cyclase
MRIRAGLGFRLELGCTRARPLSARSASRVANYRFAALGDPMNFGARLVAAAKGGEMIVSEAVWKEVSS